MNSNENFEDFFSGKFRDNQVSPSQNVWGDIEKNLWFSDIKNYFARYATYPSESVWKSIEFKLRLRNFIRFGFAHFNVYYVAIALSLILPVAYYHIPTPVPVRSADASSRETTDKKHLVMPVADNQPFTKPQSAEALVASIQTNPSPVTPIHRIESPVNTATYIPENTVQQIHSISPSENNAAIFSDEKIRPSDTYSGVIETAVISTMAERENETPTEELKDLVNEPFHFLQPLSLHSDFAQKNICERNLPVYKPRFLQWSLMPFAGLSSFQLMTQNNGLNNNDITAIKSVQTVSSVAGIQTEAQNKRFSVTAGLSVNNYHTSNLITGLINHTDTLWNQQIVHVGYFTHHDIPILDLDHYLQTGDTSYIWVHDSTYAEKTDTLYSPTVRSHSQKVQYKKPVALRYIEIPVMAGYTFFAGKFDLTLRTGITAGIVIRAGGTIVSGKEETVLTDINKTMCNTFLISGISQADFGYRLSPRWGLHVTPTFRYSFGQVLKSETATRSSFRDFGIRMGIKYSL